MIPVTQPFLPPKEEYQNLLSELWESKWLTHNGPYVQNLEKELVNYLGVSNLKYITNGTLALQLAISALDLKGEIITTPFSFVATTTSIIWGNCQPVFVDINRETLTINVNKIEEAITKNTSAILATHVYGIPCDVEAIEAIAQQYNLKIIYDAAHAFGVKYKGKSIFNYGDISIYSFHATKVFHTVEGGGITCNNDTLVKKVELLRSYGYVGNEHYLAGINAKGTEVHAAMGLANLPYIEMNLAKRKAISMLYNELLPQDIQVLKISDVVDYNYAYYPILLPSEDILIDVVKELENNGIQSRRYFYPSLNKLPYLVEANNCPISENISERILCLPLYADLMHKEVVKITEIIKGVI